MDKWDYIQKLSNLSLEYGDLLLDMMLTYDKSSFKDITTDECYEYYCSLTNNIYNIKSNLITNGIIFEKK